MAIRRSLLPTARIVLIEDTATSPFPYVKLGKRSNNTITLFLDPKKTVGGIKKELTELGNANDVDVYSLDGTRFSSNTLVSDLATDPFVVEVNNQERYGVFPISDKRQHPEPEVRILATDYKERVGMTDSTAEVLASFNHYFQKEISNLASNSINSETFKVLANSAATRTALEYYRQSTLIRVQIEALRSYFSEELKSKDAFESIADKHANKMLKRISSVFLMQFLGIQYGTYYLYSWDIMEPITCMMGMGDICLGYLFWMYSGKEYGLQGFYRYFYERKLKKLYKKEKLSQEEIERVHQVITQLESKLKTFE